MKPSIGSSVKVVLDYSQYKEHYAYNVPRETTLEGIVEKSEPFDDPNSFRLRTNNRLFPVSVILMDATLKSMDGIANAITISKTITNKRLFKVTSKGKVYMVSKVSNHYDCTCTGYQFRKSCKHINKVKETLT